MRIKVEKLPNEYLSELTESEITLYTTVENTDINGIKFETLGTECKYCNVTNILGQTLYMSKEYLLDVLLSKDLEPLINKSIFNHGYPEGRLTPSNHYEECLEHFSEEIKEEFNDMLDNIINDYS